MFVAGEQLRMKQMKMKEAETNVWHDKDLESIHKNGEFLKDLKPRGGLPWSHLPFRRYLRTRVAAGSV